MSGRSESEELISLVRLHLRPDWREVVEELRKELSEAAEIRRREADWEFILSQPPRLAQALIFLIETGDLLASARIAGISPLELDYLRVKARIIYEV